MLVPTATHVPGRQDHGGPTADVHAQQLGRALEVVLHTVLECPVMHVGVLVVGTEDRVIELEVVERAVGEHPHHLAHERPPKLLAATAGVSQQRATVKNVLPQCDSLVGAEPEHLVAAYIKDGDLGLLVRLVVGHHLLDRQVTPAVPQAQFVAAVPHQVVDVAGIGVPVLGRAVLELGHHQRRSRLGLRFAATQRGHRQRQRRKSLGGSVTLRVLARRRTTGAQPTRLLRLSLLGGGQCHHAHGEYQDQGRLQDAASHSSFQLRHPLHGLVLFTGIRVQ